MNCKLCETGKENVIYEDSEMTAVLSSEPASAGHVILFPKKHYAIIEQVPDYEFANLFSAANKLSIAIFETVKCQGTNIIIQNGTSAGQKIPHVAIHIIPRNENDSLNLQWNPKQLSEEEMSTVELQIKEEAEKIGEFEQEKKKEAVKIEPKKEKIEGEENPMISHLTRIP